jgi:UDP-2-acetamido-2,6-beta-L-arabino-hexul-4-ose reductase
MVQITPLKAAADARGLVFEPAQPEELAAQQNVHVALTAPGCVRGNHYHLNGTEIMVAPGPVLVRYRENGEIRDVAVPENAVYRFVFPPNVAHAIQNTGSRAAAIIAFNTQRHDAAKPDVVRDVILG